MIFRALFFLTVLHTPAHAQQSFNWAKSAGGYGGDEGKGVYVTTTGDIYLTGRVDHAAKFDSITLSTPGTFNSAFVARYNASADVIWALAMENVETYSICADNAGNSYIAGVLKDSIVLGNDTLTPNGRDDTFIVSFNKNGKYRWAIATGGQSAVSGERASDLDIFNNHDLYITGILDNGFYLSKYDTSGTHYWTDTVSAIYGSEGLSLDIDNTGNIYVAGYFIDHMSLQGISLVTPVSGQSSFIAKYGSSGSLFWAKTGGVSAYMESTAVSAFAGGGVVLTGKAHNSQSHDIFISRYDSSGNLRWTRIWGIVDEEERSEDIDVSADGTIIIAGFAGGDSLMNTYNRDILLLFVDSSGNIIKDFTTGSASNAHLTPEVANGLHFQGGDLFITGTFKDNTHFDSYLLSSQGSSDIFISKMNGLPLGAMVENTELARIGIFPNPATEELVVNWDLDAIYKEPHLIQILGITGTLLSEIEVISGQKTTIINTTDWNPGIYQILIRQKHKIMYSQTQVIQR